VNPRPADVDGPEIVIGGGAARAAAAGAEGRDRTGHRFSDLT
jgi:hypothetical protein